MPSHARTTHRPIFLAAAVCSVVVALPAQGDDAEFKAVTFVLKLGGSVQRDNMLSGQPVVAADLYGTAFSDAGFEPLTGLARLQRLDLGYTRITDRGLKDLKRLGNLHVLSLAGTAVTEVGLRELASLKDLHSLDLTGVRLTQAALLELPRCRNLRTLYLNGDLSKSALSELQRALPDCQVIVGAP